MDPYDEKTRLNEGIQECKRSPSQTKGQFRTKTKVAFVIAGLTIGICVLLGVCSYQAVYIYGIVKTFEVINLHNDFYKS